MDFVDCQWDRGVPENPAGEDERDDEREGMRLERIGDMKRQGCITMNLRAEITTTKAGLEGLRCH